MPRAFHPSPTTRRFAGNRVPLRPVTSDILHCGHMYVAELTCQMLAHSRFGPHVHNVHSIILIRLPRPTSIATVMNGRLNYGAFVLTGFGYIVFTVSVNFVAA
jgi:hypothetical protein